MSESDKNIEVFWARLRGGARRQPDDARAPAEAAPAEAPETDLNSDGVRLPLSLGEMAPGDVTFGMAEGRCQVLIRADGTVHYGEGYDPDTAARIFWRAIGLAHPNVALRAPDPDEEVRRTHHQTMETMLLRVGRADLHNERVQLRALADDASEHDHLVAEIAHGNLEIAVHNIIEYARAVTLRNGGA